jgi:ABC-2 type transport system permease protein
VIDAVRAEWVKFRSLPSNVVLMVCVVALSVGFSALITGILPTGDTPQGPSPIEDPASRLDLTLGGTQLAFVICGVLGILCYGTEYRHRTIRPTFTAVPNRLRVTGAKTLLITLVLGVLAALSVTGAVAVGAAVLEARGFPVGFDQPGTTRVLMGSVLLGVLYGLAGLGLGAIVRQPVGAIVGLCLWALLVEPLVAGFFANSIGKYLPFTAGAQVALRVPTNEAFGPWAGLGYFAAWVAVLLVVGSVLVSRRDA